MTRSTGAATEHVDAVIVGSGFGGSVTANRLAEAGQRVVVLERGRAYPPGSFARAPHELARALWDPSAGLQGLFDVWSFRGLAAVVASGLGGGSLIYANVLLRKDEKWFVVDDSAGGEQRRWPVSRADLDPHYDAVERMLDVQRFPLGAPGYESSGKTTAMRDAAARLGLDWQLPPLAVTFAVGGRPEPGAAIPDPPYGNLHGRLRTTCRLCGECDIGCNTGSKNTLDHTYLSAAVHHGADVRTRSEVRAFEPTGAGWAVHYVTHLPEHDGVPTDTASLPMTTITCDRLLLAAGTLGTTYLLLRNRAALPGLSRTVGTRFCGNGDLLGFVLGARDDDGRARHLGSTAAPVITSAIRVPDELDGGTGRGYYVQDAGYPGFVDWLVEGSDVPGVADRALDAAHGWVAARLLRRPESQIGARLSELLGAGARSAGAAPLLGMGRDTPDGVMRLRGRWLDVDWTTRTSQAYFDRVRTTMADLAGEFGGRFEPNPLSWLDRVVTVHPLGGAPMGHSAANGVIDSHGEVFGNPGLFVVDGAAMPGPVGANPSLTIAAFADRAATAILDGRTAAPPKRARGAGPPPRRVPPTAVPGPRPAPDGEAAPSTAGRLAFTEEMKGFVALGVTDPQRGAAQGRADGTRIAVHLTVRLDDVAGFVADPRHEGRATGWVDCEVLGGRLPVPDGTVNLLVEGDHAGSLRMDYRLFLADAVGYPLTLSGSKDVRRDSDLDAWRDTTTLALRVLAGHVEAGAEPTARVVGAGVVSLHLPDLARQLASLRVAAPDPVGQVLTLARFGGFFLGVLWRVYRPPLVTFRGRRMEGRA